MKLDPDRYNAMVAPEALSQLCIDIERQWHKEEAMKLVPFTYTNEYDKASAVHINPAYVVSLRPAKSSQTTISLASKAEITVDGTIEVVSQQLCGDDQGEETTKMLDKMPDSG